MPGFLSTMIPALKLDYGEINRRVNLLKDLCDASERCVFHMPRVSQVPGFSWRGWRFPLRSPAPA